MRKIKKSISTLLLMVFVSALFFQNVAYGLNGENDPIQSMLSGLTIEVSEEVYGDGELIQFQGSAEKNEEAFNAVTVEYGIKDVPDALVHFALYSDGQGNLSFERSINVLDVSGVYYVKKLFVHSDTYGQLTVYPSGTEHAEYTMDFSHLTFEIIGTKGGRIPDIQFMIEDKGYQPGETIEISAQLSHDEIALDALEVVIQDEQGLSSQINVRLLKMGDAFQGEFQVTPFLRSGQYRVVAVWIFAGESSTTIRNEPHGAWKTQDFSDVSFSLENTTLDDEAPILDRLEISGETYGIGESIEVKVYATDDVSGVQSGSIQLVNELGNLYHVGLTWEESYLVGRLDDHTQLTTGSYSIHSIQLNDFAANDRTYYHSETGEGENYWYFYEDFSAYKFTVESSIADFVPEVSFEIKPQNVTIGDVVTIQVTVDQSVLVSSLDLRKKMIQ